MSDIFRDLSASKLISVDVETYDPRLQEKGPGGVRRDGYVCGVSLATDDGWAEYLPIRHEGGGNLDLQKTLQYLKDQLGTDTTKLGANLLYDLEWLRAEGVAVGGRKIDVQTVAALLDEERKSYSLESLASEDLGLHKDEGGLLDFALLRGIAAKDVKGSLWMLSVDEVRPYGRQDALLPVKLYDRQLPQVVEQGLERVVDLEARLVDCLLEMRFKGVRVDAERAERSARELDARKRQIEKSIGVLCGREVDYWSNKALAEQCRRFDIKFLSTGKDNPSFEADWLAEQEHPFLKQVALARVLDRAGGVFIRKKILDVAINGRVHCQLYPVRGERHGTRSGRLSCANPNLQQVPARNEELSRLIRACFVPEPGEEWLCCDWSQVEPRITVHYAEELGLPGADVAAERYRSDPKTDYHQMTADLCGIPRKPAKTINLGLSYGMGPDKLAANLGVTRAEADGLYERYHAGMPFVRLLGKRCTALAEQRGWVRTITGRRSHFEKWGPASGSRDKDMQAVSHEEAVRRYGPAVRRYWTYRAGNRVVQGTAAELMKMALVQLYEARLTPNLTVHDEVDKSVASHDEARRVKEIMENVYKLRVPLYADCELGPSWGELEEVRL